MIKMKCNPCDGVADNELDIRLTKKCNNHCSFCIERNHGRGALEYNEDAIIETLSALPHKSYINIVGGEPLLEYDRLVSLLHALRTKHLCDHICIITSLPNLSDEQYSKVLSLVDEMVVSFQHFDWIVNNKAMQVKDPEYDRVERFRKLVCKHPKGKLSVTLNIGQHEINNSEDLIDALKFFERCGVQTLRINELDDYDEWLPLSELLPDLKLKSPYAHGCSMDVTKWFKRHYKIQIPKIKCRIRCYRLESRAPQSKEDAIKEWKKKCLRDKELAAGKKFSCERNEVTVVYEDGSTALFWEKYQ